MYTKEIDYIAKNEVDSITYEPYIILNHKKFSNLIYRVLTRNIELTRKFLFSRRNIVMKNDIIKAIGLTSDLCELYINDLYKINKDFNFKLVPGIYEHVH